MRINLETIKTLQPTYKIPKLNFKPIQKADEFVKQNIIPKVSVILPVYNAEKYITKCLDSLKNQTLNDIEIICINNGSKDNSLNILNNYADLDKRFKIINQGDLGQGIAKNTGLKAAQGEYISFIKPDTWANPSMLEYLYTIAKKNDNDFVVTEFNTFTEDNNLVKTNIIKKNTTSKIKLKNGSSFNWKDIQPSELTALGPTVWNKMYKKAFLDENNIRFGTQIAGEDIQFNVMTIFNAKNIGYSDKPLCNYTLSKDSTASKINNLEVFDIYKNVLRIVKNLGVQNQILPELDEYIGDILKFHYTRLDDNLKPKFKQLCQSKLPKRLATNAIEMTKKVDKSCNNKLTLLEKLFSIKTELDSNYMEHKILRIFGLKFEI